MLWDRIGYFREVGSLQGMQMPRDWARTEQRKKMGLLEKHLSAFWGFKNFHFDINFVLICVQLPGDYGIELTERVSKQQGYVIHQSSILRSIKLN